MLDSYYYEPLNENDVTLGSYIHIFGYKKKKEGGLCVYYQEDNKTFIDFAKANLLSKYSYSQIQSMLLSDCNFIEKTREEYRNKAAHRNEMNYTKAKECLEYIIEVKKELKKMIEPMDV